MTVSEGCATFSVMVSGWSPAELIVWLIAASYAVTMTWSLMELAVVLIVTERFTATHCPGAIEDGTPEVSVPKASLT